MRARNAFAITGVILLAGLGTMNAAQSCTPLTNQPAFDATTDGTVMVYYGNGGWSKLTPDKFGSYVSGTWSKPTTMPGQYSPVLFASAVLRDGRMIVMGENTTRSRAYRPIWERFMIP